MKRSVLILLSLAAIAAADDFKTVDGVAYKNVTVSRADPDGLVVITDAGIEKIAFARLSPDLQAKYHFNPLDAAKFQAQVEEAAAKRQADLAQVQAQQRVRWEQDAKTAEEEKEKKAAEPSPPRIIRDTSHGEGGLVKPAKFTVSEVAASPFSLKNAIVELLLPKADDIIFQEVAEGKYQVRFLGWNGGAKEIKCAVTGVQLDAIRNSTSVFVRVAEGSKTDTTVDVLGNGITYDGLATTPTFYWR